MNNTQKIDESALTPVAYALPAISFAMLWNPLFVMQGVYVKYFGFPMAAFAAVLLASRLFDAAIDPVLGAMSDWWKAKTGRRKPFVAIGGVLFMISAAVLYIPPDNPTVTYVGICLFAYFIGVTCFLIPHLAWGGELAETSHQKTKIFGYHVAASYLGLVFFYAIPLLPIFETSEITPDTMKVSALTAIAIFIVTLSLSMFLVPEGPTVKSTTNALSPKSLKALAVNRPFLVLMAAVLASGVGLGTWYGMIFLYVDVYLGLGALFSPLYLVAFAIGVAASFMWTALAKRIGKKKAWNASVIVALFTVIGTIYLSPDRTGGVSLAIVLFASTCALVSNDFMPRSVLADIVDYSTWRYGDNQGGTYFAMHLFNVKAGFAIGGALGLGVAGAMGFDPAAAEQSEAGVRSLIVVMAVIPSVCLLGAMILINMIPIDERRHAIIRRALDRRQARLQAISAE